MTCNSHISRHLARTLEIIDSAASGKRLPITGREHLDRRLVHIQPGDLIGIEEKDQGTIKNVFIEIARARRKLRQTPGATLVSLQCTSVEEYLLEMICDASGTAFSSVLHGDIDENDWENIIKATDMLQRESLYLGLHTRDFDQIRDWVREIPTLRKVGVAALMVENLAVLAEGKWSSSLGLLDELKDLAKELNTIVLVGVGNEEVDGWPISAMLRYKGCLSVALAEG